MTYPRLLVVGSGGEPFRDYVLKAMKDDVQIILAANCELTWQKSYISQFYQVDPKDPVALTDVVTRTQPDGVLTYDEQLVEQVTAVGAALGIPGTDIDAVRACRDKYATRTALAKADLGPVRCALAYSADEAAQAARRIGYPVVVKPRALGGSIGVVKAAGETELLRCFETAAGAQADDGTVSAQPGVLIEEFLDGPEYSVDCITWQGVTSPLVIAEKELAFPPYFEEHGHIVPAEMNPDLKTAIDLVVRAHEILGLDRLASHTEVKLTAAGPRIIEINARLGGDLIPYLGYLALGVDLASAAARVAVGLTPDLSASRDRAAAIAMIYPEFDIRLTEVRLPAALPGVEQFRTWVAPGTEIRLPPAGFLSRIGFVILTDDSRDRLRANVKAVREAIEIIGEPLASR